MNKWLLSAIFLILISLPPAFATEYLYQETFDTDANISDYNYLTFDTVSEFVKLPYSHSFSQIAEGIGRTWQWGVDYYGDYVAIYDYDNDDVNVLRLSNGASVFFKNMNGEIANLVDCAIALDDQNIWLACDRSNVFATKIVAYDYLGAGNKKADFDLPQNAYWDFDRQMIKVNSTFVIAIDRDSGHAIAYNKGILDTNLSFDFNDGILNSVDDWAFHLDSNYFYTFIRAAASPSDFNYSGKIFSLPHFVEAADLNNGFGGVSSSNTEVIASNDNFAFYGDYNEFLNQSGIGVVDKLVPAFTDLNGYYPQQPQYDDMRIVAVRNNRMFAGETFTVSGRYVGDFNLTDVNEIFFDSLPFEPTPYQRTYGTFAHISADYNYYLVTGAISGATDNIRLFKATDFAGIYTNQPQTITSNDINQTTNCISAARIDALENKPGGTSIQYYLSNDSGATWRSTSNHAVTTFGSCSTGVRWRAVMGTTNSSITPRILDLNVWHDDSNFIADFNYSPDPPTVLDPENGVVVSSLDFNDVSWYGDGNTWKASTWWINGSIVSYDQNFSFDFLTPSTDINVFVAVQNTGDVNRTAYSSLHIKQYPQDVNFTWNPAIPLTDVNTLFYSSCNEDANIDFRYWRFAGVYDSNTDQNINHIFTSSGTQEVCLFAHDSVDDLNKSLCANVPVAIRFRVQFWDENSGLNLQPTVSVNGVDYSASVDASGFLDLNLVQGQKVVIASSLTHSERVWSFNLTSFLDENLLLLPTVLGKDINFQFFEPNQTSLLSSALVEIQKEANGKLAGRLQTNGLGHATFFLNPNDFNYLFSIDAADGNHYDYNAAVVTTKIPINVVSGGLISPFSIFVSGVRDASFLGLAANYDINIFTETFEYYLFTVSCGTGYYQTSQAIKLQGNPSTYSYQPYCVPNDGNNLEVTIYTIDNQENRASLPGVLIESYTDVNGILTLVESKESDGTGVALMHFVFGRSYVLRFYYEGELKLEMSYVPSSTNLFVYLETGGFEEIGSVGHVNVIWYDRFANRVPHSPITLFQLLRPVAVAIGNVVVQVWHNNNLIYSDTIAVDSNMDTNISYDVNVAGLNQYTPLRVDLNIYSSLGTLIKQESAIYTFVSQTVWPDTLEYLRSGLGLLASTVISLFLCIVLMFILVAQRTGQDNSWLVVPASIVAGVFAFFQFIPFDSWILATLVGVSIAIWRVKD